MEDLRNRSRRNNLVFHNIPEKAEGQDCAAFIKEFINTHMGLEAWCGDVEIESAHRTPTKVPGTNSKKPRPVHVAFLRYTDKVKILSNAAARLKDNPYQGNLRVPLSNFHPRLCKIKKSKIAKLCHNKGLRKPFLEKYVLVCFDNNFTWTATFSVWGLVSEWKRLLFESLFLK